MYKQSPEGKLGTVLLYGRGRREKGEKRRRNLNFGKHDKDLPKQYVSGQLDQPVSNQCLLLEARFVPSRRASLFSRCYSVSAATWLAMSPLGVGELLCEEQTNSLYYPASRGTLPPERKKGGTSLCWVHLT